MLRSLRNKLGAMGRRLDLRPYLAREPAMLALLFAVAVVSFLAVSGLSRIYHAQQTPLGNRWFARGVTDLKQQRFGPAVNEFRTSLLYSRDDYDYQFNLAEALIGLRWSDQANAYLVNLWDRQPENGLVNLELARIAAQQRKRTKLCAITTTRFMLPGPTARSWHVVTLA